MKENSSLSSRGYSASPLLWKSAAPDPLALIPGIARRRYVCESTALRKGDHPLDGKPGAAAHLAGV